MSRCRRVETHPRRWDLIAYHSIDAHRTIYCKRLIGLPGERLKFEGGSLYVTDHVMATPPVLAGRCRASPSRINPHYEEGQEIVLGPNEYFYIGDNVDVSADSRFFGPSDGSAIVGVIDLMYWPMSHARLIR